MDPANIPQPPPAIRLHDADDVVVLRRPAPRGAIVWPGVEANTPIAAGHKAAIREIADGDPVRKYGHVIGFARGDIRAGDHVHDHNLEMRPLDLKHEIGSEAKPLAALKDQDHREFLGYARPGGGAGTRNYLAVISSVNCSASVSHFVRDHFRGPDLKRDFPGVDGVVAFTHKGGCAMPVGEPHVVLQRVLAGIARHPNIAGYVLIGLGCEVAQVSLLRERFSLDQLKPGESAPAFMTIQNLGGVRKTVDAGVAAVRRLLPEANALRRTPLPVSRLILAENCGGSDAHSGITANPALGVASDELVRHGGTSVLAETTEIYGAEHLLTRRAVSREVAEKLLERIAWWEDHTKRLGAAIDNNPSHGNKEGGLSTIYEKSLGAVAKGGRAPLVAVYGYAEPITAKGFCFMDTPGFDPVSMTGLVAGGCNIGVFTTGRGSVYGCKPAPCIKVSTRTALYDWMSEDIDLNAGTILDGVETVEEVGRRLFEKIIAVASGERTKSEEAGMGDEEFAPWHLGPTL